MDHNNKLGELNMIVKTTDGDRSKLVSDEGRLLTNGAVKGFVVWLAANDSEDNWSEVEYGGLQDVDFLSQMDMEKHKREQLEAELQEYKAIVNAMLGVE